MARLAELLSIPARAIIALVGAGGKTTTMYTLAHELVGLGKRVVTTTTTHIFIPRPDEAPRLLVDTDMPRLLNALREGWQDSQHMAVARAVVTAHKLQGLQPEHLPLLLQRGGADVVIVEADGARHLKIKAPAGHEPVLPAQVGMVLLLMSAEALNQPLSGDIAHRPAILADLAGIASGDPLTPAAVARLLLHAQGGLKQIPASATVYVLVTHVTQERREAVEHLAQLVLAAPRVRGLCYAQQPGAWRLAETPPLPPQR